MLRLPADQKEIANITCILGNTEIYQLLVIDMDILNRCTPEYA